MEEGSWHPPCRIRLALPLNDVCWFDGDSVLVERGGHFCCSPLWDGPRIGSKGVIVFAMFCPIASICGANFLFEAITWRWRWIKMVDRDGWSMTCSSLVPSFWYIKCFHILIPGIRAGFFFANFVSPGLLVDEHRCGSGRASCTWTHWEGLFGFTAGGPVESNAGWSIWQHVEMIGNEWCRSLGRLAPFSCFFPCDSSLFLSSYTLRNVYDVQVCCNAQCGCLLLLWTLKMRPNLTRKETSTKTQQLVQPLTSHHLFLDCIFGYFGLLWTMIKATPVPPWSLSNERSKPINQ